jgi:hypothetical protein
MRRRPGLGDDWDPLENRAVDAVLAVLLLDPGRVADEGSEDFRAVVGQSAVLKVGPTP